MRKVVQLTAVAMLLASLVATGQEHRATATGPDEDRKRLDEEIAATRAKLAGLERRRALMIEPKTHVHVAYFREMTTIEYEDNTKDRAVLVSTLDKNGNLSDARWALAANAFVFLEDGKEAGMDWDAIKPGTRVHLYCTDLQMGLGGYGPPVLKVGIPAKARPSDKRDTASR